jgi:hypothetical protein
MTRRRKRRVEHCSDPFPAEDGPTDRALLRTALFVGPASAGKASDASLRHSPYGSRLHCMKCALWLLAFSRLKPVPQTARPPGSVPHAALFVGPASAGKASDASLRHSPYGSRLHCMKCALWPLASSRLKPVPQTARPPGSVPHAALFVGPASAGKAPDVTPR